MRTQWRGQLLGSLIICGSVIFLAMPLAIIGRTFTAVWDAREIVRLHAKFRAKLINKGITSTELVIALRANGQDGEDGLGLMGLYDFCNQVRSLHSPASGRVICSSRFALPCLFFQLTLSYTARPYSPNLLLHGPDRARGL